VQCIGGKEGFLWCDNRPFIAAPTRRGVGQSGVGGEYPMAPVAPKQSKQEEATSLRRQLEAFCRDAEALKKFYGEVTPIHPASMISGSAKDEKEVDVVSSGVTSPLEIGSE